VHFGGGGGRIAATQIAKHIGATVVGTASPRTSAIEAFGADHLIDYRREDFVARTRE